MVNLLALSLKEFCLIIFHSTPEDHTFFSTVQGSFSRIDSRLGHKTGLNKFKKI